ncbi:DUF4326 domain-containing protein [Amycolatopsis sp. NPDC051903]|uniref:DUF4326 domain-containing protein n=1 Tax=Amycolatopsis sp. NPDC051903 TaxID=3363936 RepID=UPI00378A98CD
MIATRRPVFPARARTTRARPTSDGTGEVIVISSVSTSTSRPTRVCRQRTRGWRKPPGAAIIDRNHSLGNPFTVAAALAAGDVDSADEAPMVCREQYRRWITGAVPNQPDVLGCGRRTVDRR